MTFLGDAIIELNIFGVLMHFNCITTTSQIQKLSLRINGCIYRASQLASCEELVTVKTGKPPAGSLPDATNWSRTSRSIYCIEESSVKLCQTAAVDLRSQTCPAHVGLMEGRERDRTSKTPVAPPVLASSTKDHTWRRVWEAISQMPERFPFSSAELTMIAVWGGEAQGRT